MVGRGHAKQGMKMSEKIDSVLGLAAKQTLLGVEAGGITGDAAARAHASASHVDASHSTMATALSQTQLLSTVSSNGATADGKTFILTPPSSYSFSAAGSFVDAGTTYAEDGKVSVVVSGNTLLVTITNTTPLQSTDGQSIGYVELQFDSGATAPTLVSSAATVVGSVTTADIGKSGASSITNVTTQTGGTLAGWDAKMSGHSVFLAAVGPEAPGGQPLDLIADTNSLATKTANSFSTHAPNIENSVTFSITFTGAPPTITGAKLLFGTDATASDHIVTGTLTCYLEGTRIAVSSTDAALVETLKAGELVLTDDGRQVPVLWVGYQTVSRAFADPLRAYPIRIKAGALGDTLPERDLLVSACHAILVDGVLVQAGALINGVSIVRETALPASFVYYHVELDDHSLILAEGVATETFIDNASRMSFDNWNEHETLFPEGREMTEMVYPRVTSARQLPASIRRRLEDRAGAISERALVAA